MRYCSIIANTQYYMILTAFIVYDSMGYLTLDYYYFEPSILTMFDTIILGPTLKSSIASSCSDARPHSTALKLLEAVIARVELNLDLFLN